MNKSICLNMIVKNESAVILRALRSAKPLIQHWVIVDTGSVDDTPLLIRDFLKEIPGELHERPWVDFAHNRNEALSLAKGKADYLLFLDADDELILESGFCMPSLEKDFYLVSYRESVGGFVDAAYAVFLVDNRLSWRWEGVLHEHLVCPEAKTHEAMACIYNTIRHDGGRSQDPEKLDKDIAILKAALEREPDQSRYVYFLGESTFCKGDFQGAREAYTRRVKMGGYKEEIYRSFHYLGKCNYLLQKYEEALHSYCQAYQFDPERIEPLYDLSWIFFNEGQPLLSYLVARFGVAQIGHLKPQLRSQPWIADGGFLELLIKSGDSLSKKCPFLP